MQFFFRAFPIHSMTSHWWGYDVFAVSPSILYVNLAPSRVVEFSSSGSPFTCKLDRICFATHHDTQQTHPQRIFRANWYFLANPYNVVLGKNVTFLLSPTLLTSFFRPWKQKSLDLVVPWSPPKIFSWGVSV